MSQTIPQKKLVKLIRSYIGFAGIASTKHRQNDGYVIETLQCSILQAKALFTSLSSFLYSMLHLLEPVYTIRHYVKMTAKADRTEIKFYESYYRPKEDELLLDLTVVYNQLSDTIASVTVFTENAEDKVIEPSDLFLERSSNSATLCQEVELFDKTTAKVEANGEMQLSFNNLAAVLYSDPKAAQKGIMYVCYGCGQKYKLALKRYFEQNYPIDDTLELIDLKLELNEDHEWELYIRARNIYEQNLSENQFFFLARISAPRSKLAKYMLEI